MNNTIDSDKLLKISSELPHGSGKRIQEMTGYSQVVVSAVRNGRMFVPVVIEAMLQIHKEEKKKIEELNEKIMQA